MTYAKLAAPALALGLCVMLNPAASAHGRKHKRGSANREETAQSFSRTAWEGNLAEVKLGQLAQQKGCSDQVKQFGNKMVDDHGKANDQLKSNVEGNVNWPSALSPKDQTEYDRLSKLSCPAFDQQYMALMIRDHKHDIAEFKREGTHGTDTKLKTYANNTLPTLEGHLSMAEQTMAAIRGEKGTPTASMQNQGYAAREESTVDRNFLNRGAEIDIAEIELGKLAQSKANDNSVKHFAHTLVNDHQKNLDKLKSLAPSGYTLPTEASKPNLDLKNRLSQMSGPAFDQAYVNAMVRGHQQAIAEYQQEARNGKDANLKSFASSSVPALQDHLQMAENTRAQVMRTEGQGAASRQK